MLSIGYSICFESEEISSFSFWWQWGAKIQSGTRAPFAQAQHTLVQDWKDRPLLWPSHSFAKVISLEWTQGYNVWAWRLQFIETGRTGSYFSFNVKSFNLLIHIASHSCSPKQQTFNLIILTDIMLFRYLLLYCFHVVRGLHCVEGLIIAVEFYVFPSMWQPNRKSL